MILWALACAPAPDGAPCEVSGTPAMELAPTDVDFGAFTDGDPLYYGVPPQGGALYSPFHARVAGIGDLDVSATVSMVGTEPDGTALAATDYQMRLVCANVGESAGQWLGTDLHLRFGEWEIAELAGRAMRVEVTIANVDGDSVTGALEGVLTEVE